MRRNTWEDEPFILQLRVLGRCKNTLTWSWRNEARSLPFLFFLRGALPSILVLMWSKVPPSASVVLVCKGEGSLRDQWAEFPLVSVVSSDSSISCELLKDEVGLRFFLRSANLSCRALLERLKSFSMSTHSAAVLCMRSLNQEKGLFVRTAIKFQAFLLCNLPQSIYLLSCPWPMPTIVDHLLCNKHANQHAVGKKIESH